MLLTGYRTMLLAKAQSYGLLVSLRDEMFPLAPTTRRKRRTENGSAPII